MNRLCPGYLALHKHQVSVTSISTQYCPTTPQRVCCQLAAESRSCYLLRQTKQQHNGRVAINARPTWGQSALFSKAKSPTSQGKTRTNLVATAADQDTVGRHLKFVHNLLAVLSHGAHILSVDPRTNCAIVRR